MSKSKKNNSDVHEENLRENSPVQKASKNNNSKRNQNSVSNSKNKMTLFNNQATDNETNNQVAEPSKKSPDRNSSTEVVHDLPVKNKKKGKDVNITGNNSSREDNPDLSNVSNKYDNDNEKSLKSAKSENHFKIKSTNLATHSKNIPDNKTKAQNNSQLKNQESSPIQKKQSNIKQKLSGDQIAARKSHKNVNLQSKSINIKASYDLSLDEQLGKIKNNEETFTGITGLLLEQRNIKNHLESLNITLEDKLMNLKTFECTSSNNNVMFANRQSEEKVALLSKELDANKKLISNLQKDLSKVESRASQLKEQDYLDNIEKEIVKIKNQISQKLRENSEIRCGTKGHGNVFKNYEEKGLTQEGVSLLAQKQHLKRIKQKVNALKEPLDGSKERIAQTEKECQTLEEELKQLQKEAEGIPPVSVDNHTKLHSELLTKKATVEKDVAALTFNLKRYNQTCKTNIGFLENQVKESKNSVTEITSKVTEESQQLKVLQEEIAKANIKPKPPVKSEPLHRFGGKKPPPPSEKRGRSVEPKDKTDSTVLHSLSQPHGKKNVTFQANNDNVEIKFWHKIKNLAKNAIEQNSHDLSDLSKQQSADNEDAICIKFWKKIKKAALMGEEHGHSLDHWSSDDKAEQFWVKIKTQAKNQLKRENSNNNQSDEDVAVNRFWKKIKREALVSQGNTNIGSNKDTTSSVTLQKLDKELDIISEKFWKRMKVEASKNQPVSEVKEDAEKSTERFWKRMKVEASKNQPVSEVKEDTEKSTERFWKRMKVEASKLIDLEKQQELKKEKAKGDNSDKNINLKEKEVKNEVGSKVEDDKIIQKFWLKLKKEACNIQIENKGIEEDKPTNAFWEKIKSIAILELKKNENQS